jgi:hypothetical protein
MTTLAFDNAAKGIRRRRCNPITHFNFTYRGCTADMNRNHSVQLFQRIIGNHGCCATDAVFVPALFRRLE